MIGRVLGHYRILEKVGAGGMGVVYRARDERLHRDVAIKVLSDEGQRDRDARRRIDREARALSQLNHPNIEAVHAFEHHEGVDYLVLELVEGESLGQWVARGALPEARVLDLGIQLASALEAAHAQGIIHRDLKPSNLMVTPDGRLKVLDFGLARLTQVAGASLTFTATESGFIMGTIPYMAPEMLSDGTADTRGDLYGMGAVLYEAATGRRPFGGDTGRLMFTILNEPPPAPSVHGAGLSRDLERLIMELLAKSPAERPASATEVRAALEAIRARGGESGAIAHHPRSGMRRGIPRPIRRHATVGVIAAALAVAAAVTVKVIRSRQSDDADRVRSVAVLPFANLSGKPEQQYLADGLTDQLILELSALASLRVISRTSVMQYRDKALPLGRIMDELGVDAVVEGSVLQEGARLRVGAKLIGDAERSLWTETYDRAHDDVLVIQQEIARKVAVGIGAQLSPRDEKRLSGARRVDPEAYDAYLKGVHRWNQPYVVETFRQAEAYFRRSLDLEPGFAPAWAGLAHAYYEQSGWALAPEIAMPKARVAAERALAIDPDLPEALTVLATVKFAYEWDWVNAERLLQRLVAVAPWHAEAHAKYSYLLCCLGRIEESIREIREARIGDPFSTTHPVLSLYPLHGGRRYEECVRAARSFIEEDSARFENVRFIMAQSLCQLGRCEEALSELNRLLPRYDYPVVRGWRAYLLARVGRREEAAAELTRLEARARTEHVPALCVAMAHLGLGNRDKALAWLERGVRERHETTTWLGVSPELASLRDDPRYMRLLREVGLDGVIPPP